MILKVDVLRLHQLSIKKYGGSFGIRDDGLLDSAIARPYQTFDGTSLYATPLLKTAAMAESLIINHPFIDGNKRTGFLSMFALLRKENIALTADEELAYNFTIEVSTGKLKFDDIVLFLRNNTQSL